MPICTRHKEEEGLHSSDFPVGEWGKFVCRAWSSSDGLVVAPDVIHRVVGEESVLLNLKTEVYFGADSVATQMWNTLTSADTIQTAFETLLAEYEVAPAKLRGDIEEFVGRLLEHNLIEIKPTSSARE